MMLLCRVLVPVPLISSSRHGQEFLLAIENTSSLCRMSHECMHSRMGGRTREMSSRGNRRDESNDGHRTARIFWMMLDGILWHRNNFTYNTINSQSRHKLLVLDTHLGNSFIHIIKQISHHDELLVAVGFRSRLSFGGTAFLCSTSGRGLISFFVT
jgi:hypothetical protein